MWRLVRVACSRLRLKDGDTPWTSNDIGNALFTRTLDQAHQNARSIRSLLRSEGLVIDVRPVLVVWGAAGKHFEGLNTRHDAF
jgi:hypothetical protein